MEIGGETIGIKKVNDNPMVIHKKKRVEPHGVKKDKSMNERKGLKIQRIKKCNIKY